MIDVMSENASLKAELQRVYKLVDYHAAETVNAKVEIAHLDTAIVDRDKEIKHHKSARGKLNGQVLGLKSVLNSNYGKYAQPDQQLRPSQMPEIEKAFRRIEDLELNQQNQEIVNTEYENRLTAHTKFISSLETNYKVMDLNQDHLAQEHLEQATENSVNALGFKRIQTLEQELEATNALIVTLDNDYVALETKLGDFIHSFDAPKEKHDGFMTGNDYCTSPTCWCKATKPEDKPCDVCGEMGLHMCAPICPECQLPVTKIDRPKHPDGLTCAVCGGSVLEECKSDLWKTPEPCGICRSEDPEHVCPR
jgi:hypothetical protein